MPKMATLYDQGSALHVEDGHAINFPFAIVADGVSAPYNRENPLRLFEGQPGGVRAARIVEEEFAKARGSDRLDEVLLKANTRVGELQTAQGISLKRADQLAGVAFAALKWSTDEIVVIQAGDCFAIWECQSGEVGVTRNQVGDHDRLLMTTVNRLLQEIAAEYGVTLETADTSIRTAIRNEMWERYYPTACTARLRDANSPKSPYGYGILNGQSTLARAWSSTTLKKCEVHRVLLLSDGLIPWAITETQDEHTIARTLLTTYRAGGLPAILASARGLEKHMKTTHYTDFAEATGIAIEF